MVNGTESGFLDALEGVGGFGGKADQLNGYLTFVGTPDYFEEDLARFRALSVRDVQDAAQTFLRPEARVVLSVVPQGQTAQAAPNSSPAQNVLSMVNGNSQSSIANGMQVSTAPLLHPVDHRLCLHSLPASPMRFRLLPLLLLLAAPAVAQPNWSQRPALQAPPRFTMPPIERFTLSNGLPVLLVEKPRRAAWHRSTSSSARARSTTRRARSASPPSPPT